MNSYEQSILTAKAISSKKGLNIKLIEIGDISSLAYGNCDRYKLNPCKSYCGRG